MRHATASGAGGGTDHARPLKPIGHEEAEHVGARLVELGAEPDRVLSSSAIRCRETFDSLCIGMKTRPPVDFDDALYNSAPEQLLHGLAGTFAGGDDSETLLLLAHNPGVSMLASDLGGGSDSDSDEALLRSGFAPATFAVFEIDDEGSGVSQGTTRLLHFERPA